MDLTTLSIYIVLLILIAYISLKLYQSLDARGGKREDGLKHPPCLPRLPIVGSLPFIPNPKKSHIHLMRKSKEIGNIIGVYMGNSYYIVLNGRKTIYEALVKKGVTFACRPSYFVCRTYNPNRKGIGEHPYDEEFKIYHKACLNVFKKFGLGQGFMEERIGSELEHFIQMIKLREGKAFEPSLTVTLSVYNIISGILYGKRWSMDDPEFQKCHELTGLITRGFILEFYPMLRFLPHFRGRFNELIQATKDLMKFIENNIKSMVYDASVDTFCSRFDEELKALESQKGNFSWEIDKEQHRMLIRDLTVAGTEATSFTVLWFMYFMANNQDVQKQIRDELDRVVGSKRLPSIDDKPNLPLTEACMLEVMRIRTLGPLGMPHRTINESIIDEVCIPAGVNVLPNLYSAHMDPDVWDEPETFKIERFLNEDRREVINQDLVIPFSLGKRSCLGEPLARLEVFLFISTLIQQFLILPPEGQSKVVAEEIIGLVNGPTPFDVRLVDRKLKV